MEFLPILQDFVPHWGLLPCYLLNLHDINVAGHMNRLRYDVFGQLVQLY